MKDLSYHPLGRLYCVFSELNYMPETFLKLNLTAKLLKLMISESFIFSNSFEQFSFSHK